MTSLREEAPQAQAATDRRLKVAVAGLGVASTQVLPMMAETPEVELFAAADVRSQALQAFREKYHGRGYDSVKALCEDPDVDVVWVSTPNQFHCEHTITAAERGKHVVVEKPMALNIDEAERMVAAAEKNGVQLLCGHTQSFNPSFRAMRRIIDSGELGRLCAVNIWSYTEWMLRPRMPQEVDLQLGGGIGYRQGPHQVDTVRLLGGGMVRTVRGMTGDWMRERQCPGYYAAYIQFEDRTPATIVHNGYGYFLTSEFIWGFQEEDQRSLEGRVRARRALRARDAQEEQEKEAMRFGGRRAGEREAGQRARPFMPGDVGIVLASCERGDMRQLPSGNLMIYDDEGRRELPVSGASASRSTELQELVEALSAGRNVFHDGRWGMATLEVCLAIMQSAREDREIRMSHQSPTHD